MQEQNDLTYGALYVSKFYCFHDGRKSLTMHEVLPGGFQSLDSEVEAYIENR